MGNSQDKPNCESEECIKLLKLMLDDQATNEQREYFFAHIESCIYCFDEYNIGTEIKQLVQAKTNKEKVPVDLIKNIRSVILSNS